MKRARHRTIETIGYLSKYMPPFDENDEADRERAEKTARDAVMQRFKEICAEYTRPDTETITLDMSEDMDTDAVITFHCSLVCGENAFEFFHFDVHMHPYRMISILYDIA